MVQHFFFLFFFLLSFLVSLWVGFVLFCFVSLTKEKLLLGQRAGGCPAPGWGLPMNVRLRSPAKGAVQSAGHALLTGQALS